MSPIKSSSVKVYLLLPHLQSPTWKPPKRSCSYSYCSLSHKTHTRDIWQHFTTSADPTRMTCKVCRSIFSAGKDVKHLSPCSYTSTSSSSQHKASTTFQYTSPFYLCQSLTHIIYLWCFYCNYKIAICNTNRNDWTNTGLPCCMKDMPSRAWYG